MAEFSLGPRRPVKGQLFLRAQDRSLTLLNQKLVNELRTLPTKSGQPERGTSQNLLCHAEVCESQPVSSMSMQKKKKKERVNKGAGLGTLLFTRLAGSGPESGNLRLKNATFPGKWDLLRSCSWATAPGRMSAKHPRLLLPTPPSPCSLGSRKHWSTVPQDLQHPVIYHVSVTCSALTAPPLEVRDRFCMLLRS